MELASEQHTAYLEETARLFYVFRVTQLNLRYYGARANRLSRQVTMAQALAAFLSASALALLSIPGMDLRLFAGICAASAGLVAGTLPSFGWSEKSRELFALHVAHKQLFGQVQEVIQEIKRDSYLSERSLGASQVILDNASRLEMLDEQSVDNKLRDKVDQEVRQAFPPDYLWTSL